MRYFRIIFSTGKLNIKENKETTAMRSFLLKDLIGAQEQYFGELDDHKNFPITQTASKMRTITEL